MRSVAELEDALATPRTCLVEELASLDGDLLVLGAGGKLGPSLVRLALRATAATQTPRRVIAVSRFGDAATADQLAAAGAEVVRADIGDDERLARLPDAANVMYLVGAKFGTAGDEGHTWYTNAYLPGRIMARYRASRVVALSTGNVYPFVPAASGGCTEDTPPDPVGEYAMSCLGRERVIGHVAAQLGTQAMVLRLNYAVEMRYGVLVDLALAVRDGAPVDVTMGQVNVVWQGYANEVTLRALGRAGDPPPILNVAGPETLSVRELATALARRMGKEPRFVGTEAPTALLSNAGACHRMFGYPPLTAAALVELVADWIAAGLPTHGKPTAFQRRDGQF